MNLTTHETAKAKTLAKATGEAGTKSFLAYLEQQKETCVNVQIGFSMDLFPAYYAVWELKTSLENRRARRESPAKAEVES